MLTGEMAKYQIQDRVREAEAYRAAKSTNAGRAAERQSRVRKIASSALSAVLWPIKH